MIRTFAIGTIILVALVLSCNSEIGTPEPDFAETPNTSPSLNPATRVPAIAPLVPPTPAPPRKPATPLPAAIEGPYPPPALLEISGVKQASMQSSYCWGDERRAPVCADAAGIPTALAPLVTPRQFTARFFLSFTQPVTEVHLNVYPVTLEQQLGVSSRGVRRWRPEQKGREEHTLKPESAKFIDLSLERGLHVLSLFVRVEGRGDASYGFLVEVK